MSEEKNLKGTNICLNEGAARGFNGRYVLRSDLSSVGEQELANTINILPLTRLGHGETDRVGLK
jgi:hypothetical protein